MESFYVSSKKNGGIFLSSNDDFYILPCLIFKMTYFSKMKDHAIYIDSIMFMIFDTSHFVFKIKNSLYILVVNSGSVLILNHTAISSQR